MKLLISIALIITCSSLIFAQDVLITDRPDQGDSPFTVGKRTVQIETGFIYEITNGNAVTLRNITANTSLLRIGLTQNFELRIAANYNLISQKINDNDYFNLANGVTPLQLGFKFNILEGGNNKPVLGFVGYASLADVGADDFRTDNTVPGFRLTASQSITNRIGFGLNLGAEFLQGSDPLHLYNAAFTAVLDNQSKATLYAEFYGFVQNEAFPDHRFNGGLLYLINNNFQIDANAGIGLSDISPDYFLGAGISYRFK